jgi:hypothetical protein
MVELDGYPAAATPRRAARLPGFPYNGQLAAAAIGPAGEWLELVEVAGLPRQGN